MKLSTVVSARTNKAVYRDGDMAIKVFGSSFSKTEVLGEALNQTMAEEAGLPVPVVLGVTRIEGKWAIVSDFIEGRTLSMMMSEKPRDYFEYLELFVDIQIDMHTKRAPLMPALWNRMHLKLDQADMDDATRFALHAKLAAMPKHNKICHGHFCPDNIIITPTGQHYILDWPLAAQGNASADVARTYLLFLVEGKHAAAEHYLDLFCRKSQTDKSYVQGWISIVAAVQSVNGGMEEREFLYNWMNIYYHD
ncbi:MAG: aminoglycoside phosphotransferase family protein [Oscillospiraceae bacterium]|jgi:aminoglycoside phosphotransferase (APT) family kinase protein|nr:aminoglycoside phosphotransferase family protein [Oscillospiraceae bacterium]